MSYINALIRLNNIKDAKTFLDKAKRKFQKADSLDKLQNNLNDLGLFKKSSIKEIKIQPNILDNLKLDQAIKLANKKIKGGFKRAKKYLMIFFINL